MEVKEKQIAFCQRVNDIYMKLTGDYNKDDHYFDSCSFYPAGTLVDRQGRTIMKDKYIIRGRYTDFIREFDHNPTDREINNALVYRFGLDSRFLMD